MPPSGKVKLNSSTKGSNATKDVVGIKAETEHIDDATACDDDSDDESLITIRFKSKDYGNAVYEDITPDIKVKSIIDLWRQTYCGDANDEVVLEYTHGGSELDIEDKYELEDVRSWCGRVLVITVETYPIKEITLIQDGNLCVIPFPLNKVFWDFLEDNLLSPPYHHAFMYKEATTTGLDTYKMLKEDNYFEEAEMSTIWVVSQ